MRMTGSGRRSDAPRGFGRAEAAVEAEPSAGARMRKVGGNLTNQLSDAFAAVEAKFSESCRACVMCEAAVREDGRRLCQPCQDQQRPPKLSAEERARRQLQSFAIERQCDVARRRKAAA